MRIVGFKTDIHDNTIAFPQICVKPSNLDFDGDEIYVILLFENSMAKTFASIHPKEFIMSKDSLVVSKSIGITIPETISLDAWLTKEEDYLIANGYDFSNIPCAAA